MNIYDDNTQTSNQIISTLIGVDPQGTTSYYEFTAGSYYVGWGNLTNSYSSIYTFEKGKKYTATLNTAEDAVTVTLD